MEILSNFVSIYCFISFVIGAVIMLVSLSIAAMGKDYEPRNKVRFFVKVLGGSKPWLYIQKKGGILSHIFPIEDFKEFGLNPNDFADMKECEIREVFLNLED